MAQKQGAEFEVTMIEEELEVLKSIYMDDLCVIGNKSRPEAVQITLHPYTGEDEESKYVCMTLILKFSQQVMYTCKFPPVFGDSDRQYPNKEPLFEIKSPRGISDAHISSIIQNLKALASQRLGDAMLFELIEYAKDSLTDNNRPSCSCIICLDNFTNTEEFVRTECYHYFHNYCLKKYIMHTTKSNTIDDDRLSLADENDGDKQAEKGLLCPVCRVAINPENEVLNLELPEEPTEEVVFSPTKEYIKWRREMDVLYQKQKQKGGIIDLEAEKNKYLVHLALPVKHAHEEKRQVDQYADEVRNKSPVHITNESKQDKVTIRKKTESSRGRKKIYQSTKQKKYTENDQRTTRKDTKKPISEDLSNNAETKFVKKYDGKNDFPRKTVSKSHSRTEYSGTNKLEFKQNLYDHKQERLCTPRNDSIDTVETSGNLTAVSSGPLLDTKDSNSNVQGKVVRPPPGFESLWKS